MPLPAAIAILSFIFAGMMAQVSLMYIEESDTSIGYDPDKGGWVWKLPDYSRGDVWQIYNRLPKEWRTTKEKAWIKDTLPMGLQQWLWRAVYIPFPTGEEIILTDEVSKEANEKIIDDIIGIPYGVDLFIDRLFGGKHSTLPQLVERGENESMMDYTNKISLIRAHDPTVLQLWIRDLARANVIIKAMSEEYLGVGSIRYRQITVINYLDRSDTKRGKGVWSNNWEEWGSEYMPWWYVFKPGNPGQDNPRTQSENWDPNRDFVATPIHEMDHTRQGAGGNKIADWKPDITLAAIDAWKKSDRLIGKAKASESRPVYTGSGLMSKIAESQKQKTNRYINFITLTKFTGGEGKLVRGWFEGKFTFWAEVLMGKKWILFDLDKKFSMKNHIKKGIQTKLRAKYIKKDELLFNSRSVQEWMNRESN